MARAVGRNPVLKVGQGWASLSSLPYLLGLPWSMAGRPALLLRFAYPGPVEFAFFLLLLWVPVTSSCCQSSASGNILFCSGFCLLLLPLGCYAATIPALDQTHSTPGPLHQLFLCMECYVPIASSFLSFRFKVNVAKATLLFSFMASIALVIFLFID